MNGENIHAGHRERLKDEFFIHGGDSLGEIRILELLLFYAIPQKDTNALAHALIKRFGTLSNVFKASQAELCEVQGVGKSTAVLIKLVPEIYRKAAVLEASREAVTIGSTGSAGKLAADYYAGAANERFILISLTPGNELLKIDSLSEGTVDSVSVDTRRIIEFALSAKASRCIIAHNHPGGIAQPSDEDISVTKKVRSALENVNIPLLDHIIVAGSKTFSFADRGLI